MGAIVFLVVLLLIAVGGIAGGLLMGQRVAVLIGGCAAAFAVLFLVGTGAKSIGPSDVGIVTFGGHTVGGDRAPGWTFIWPGQTMTVWDASVKYASFEGPPSTNGHSGCLQVRIANQQQACLDVTIWYKLNRSNADSQFVQYRTLARMQQAYFSRTAVVPFFNNVFERFDPVTLASFATRPSTSGGQDVSALTRQVADDIRRVYGRAAYIQRVSVSSPQYSHTVESALETVVKAQASNNVALINERTAVATAAAAKTLAQSGNLTSNYLTHECLQMTETLAQSGNPIGSQTWTCNLFGAPGNAGVLVPGGGTGKG